MKKIIILIIILLVLSIGFFYYSKYFSGVWPAIKPSTEDISKNTELPLNLPEEFSISVFAKDLDSPRVMIFGKPGLLVSLLKEGKVVALRDNDNDGKVDEKIIIAENLSNPHGLAERCDIETCKLYIAESDQVAVYDYDNDFKAINKKKIIDLPDGGNHVTRTIMFMPWPDDDKLLISVGSSCNVCNEKDWRRAAILSVDSDGSNLMEYAGGLRNSVFMAIHPVNGDIWATEMGRDFLGDDLPSDEINIIKKGKWYGWPWFYGKNIEDYDFSPRSRPSFATEPEPSYIDIPAHSAPLGLSFFPEEGWPEEYWHNLLVAYHGSWNRNVPTGYKIVRYKLDEKGNYLGEEDFISGWLTDNDVLGRPVDILIQPGGVIYVSDDKAGVVYRVTFL